MLLILQIAAGIILAVVTADCVPIILYDIKNEIIGCIHAGWKGAYNDIVDKVIKKICNKTYIKEELN